MSEPFAFVPLSQSLPYWPSDIIGQPAFLDEIGVRDFTVDEATGLSTSGTLLWYRELSFDLPLIDGFSLAFLSAGGHAEVPFELDIEPLPELRLPSLTAALRLRGDLLRPVRQEAGRWVPDTDSAGRSKPAEVRLQGVGLLIDADGEIQLLLPAGAPALGLDPVEIGETGVVLEITGLTPYLSASQPPPAGAPAGFRGVALDAVQLHLPRDLDVPIPPGDLTLEHMLIGIGGFSGTVRGTWNPAFDPATNTFDGNGAGNLFSIPFGMRSLEFGFAQNVPTAAGLSGDFILPFFDQPVRVDLSLSASGGYAVALSSTQPAGVTQQSGVVSFEKDGVLRCSADALAFRRDRGVATVKLSGKITPLIPGIDWPTFEVRELSIDSDGDVKLEGGWLDLREAYSLDFFGFRMEITKLGFGKTDDGGKWIGFSGGVKLVDGLSAGASVEGLRVTWYDDGRSSPSVSLNGVGVEFEVPGVLRFKGEVSYREEIHRFDGDITLDLVALDMQIDAQLVIGSAGTGADRYTFFAIYLGLELPAGIPLGATGLALYGMAGLFALEMEPDKRADEEWFENADGSPGWYMRPTEGVDDLGTKWAPARGSLALGAGVTLGTVNDNGYTFSGKLLLAIVFPGPILLIDGRANLLKERSKLDEDALFRAFAVLDGREGTFLLNLAAEYKHGSGAELIDIRGSAEAFFDFSDADAWHLYLGEKEPREKRIRAEIFRLFQANSYLMLDARQVAMGAWVGYDKQWTFPPLSVTVEAWIEGNVVLSAKPVYLHGDLWLHGSAGVRALGVGVTLDVDAQFAADVFDPFHLLATFTVGIGMPWPISDIEQPIELEWGPEGDVPPLPMPLKEIAVEHFKTTTSWPLTRPSLLKPVYDTDGDGFVNEGSVSEVAVGALEVAEPPADAPVVPLDCRPHITFGRAVHDKPLVGTNANFVVPATEWVGDPAKKQGPLEVEYSLRKIELHKFDGTWSLVARRSDTETAVGELYGSWAPVAGTGGDGVSQVKLWLWSKSAFDYTRHSGRAWDEWFTDQLDDYPCIPSPPDRQVCCDFEAVAPGQLLPSPYNCPDHEKLTISWLYPRQLTVTVLDPPISGFAHALCFPSSVPGPAGTTNANQIVIGFPEPATSVRILIAENVGEGRAVGTISAGDLSQVKATGYKAGGQSVGPVTPSGNIIELLADTETPGDALTRVVVRGEVCILQVCINIGPDPEQVQLQQEMAQHLIDEMARWSQKGKVLEPYSNYRLTVVTRISALPGMDDIASEEVDLTEFAYFRTEGPPGLTALSTPVGLDDTTFDSGLDDLTRYVGQTVPATVPAAGEKPPLPRPVYRSYDVGVDFNENYVDLMYRIAGRDLGLYLYDNNNQPVRDLSGRLIVLNNRWGVTQDLALTESDTYWITTVDGSDCAEVDTILIPHSNTLAAGNEEQVLDADTLYEARLVPLLLHETLDGYEVGDTAIGTGAKLGRWTVADEGTNAAPSVWDVREQGTPASRYIIQTSNIWGGTRPASDPVKPGTLLVYGDTGTLLPGHSEQPSNWTDYRLSVYLRAQDNDALGVVFRFVDAGHHYRFLMDRERKYRRLLKIYDDATTVLAEDDFTYTLDRDYLITVETVGASLRVYQDDELVFDVVDESMRAGTVGLYCWANTGARFGDVRVDDFSRAAPIVYRFKFTTSRFTNFFHHLHSYQDETWRAVLPDNAAVTAAVAAAVDAATSISGGEARAYEELAQSAGLTTRPNPTELQVTRLELGDESSGGPEPFALLVQCSEPIDWSRAQLELWYTQRAGMPVETPQDTKLTDVTVGASAPNEESVTLLLREAVDLTDYRLEYKNFPGPLATTGPGEILFADDFGEDAGLIFAEDFGPNALDHYNIVDEGTYSAPSNWSVVGGRIVQISNIHGGDTSASAPEKPGTTALVNGSEAWAAVRLQVTFNSGDNDAIGVVFRYADADNYYRVSFDRERGYRRLVKKLRGDFTVLWEDVGTYNTGQSYSLVVDAFADRLVARLDGVPLFSVRDADLGAGQVGLYCWANRPSRFEALEVESLHADPVLWEPAFVDLSEVEIVDEGGAISGPSQWEAASGVLTQASNLSAPGDGVHFPGTYALAGEPRWRDVQISARLRSDDDDAIGVMFRYVDGDNYYRFSMDLQRNYRRLIKKVAGVVTTLWQDAVAYNVGQSYDLTIRVAGRELRAHLDGVLLFAVYDGDLYEGRVAFYCSDNTGAHFERVLVTDATRRVGTWVITDEGAASARSVWGVGGGALLQTSSIGDGNAPEYPGTFAVGGETSWADYRLTVEMRADDSGAIGVVFRYADPDNYYRLSLDHQHNYRRLIKRAAGIVTILWAEVGGYTVGADLTLTVDAAGSHLVGYIDSEQLFDVTDDTHPGGQVGLYCSSNTGARFDAVEVREPPAEAYALLIDRFTAGDTTGWTFVDEGTTSAPSAWATFGGALRQTSNIFEPPNDTATLSKRGTQAIAGDPTWTDVLITARLQSFDDDAIGVVFRYMDADNYYRFSMDSQRRYRRLVKKVAGIFTLLWEDDFAYEVGRSYELTFTLTGGYLRGHMDGVPVFAVEDADMPDGRVGLYCWGNTDARFSHVRVFSASMVFDGWLLDDAFDTLDGNAWTFVDDGPLQGPSLWQLDAGWLRQTSSIRDGDLSGAAPEKLGTYALGGDAAWTDYRMTVHLASFVDDAIGVMFRYTDADNYYRLSIDSERGYRRLTKTVGGAVAVLWEDSWSYEVGREYLITVACDGEHLSGYLDGVTLFALDDADLSVGRIGLYCWGNEDARFARVQVAAPVWTTYYSFSGEEDLRAGTRVQVLAGNELELTGPSDEAALVRRFVATLSDNGTLRLPRSGCDLRLVAPAGQTAHARRFLPEGDYDVLNDVRIVRKADGTAFVLTLPSEDGPGSLLLQGEYRLRLTYRRDNQAVAPKSQVLSQAGTTAPEVVTLDVPWLAH